MLSSMATHSPKTPPEYLSAFQPLIGQMLNQSVQEMLPHLIASLMPAVSSQMKTPNASAGTKLLQQPITTTTNPLLSGVLGLPSDQQHSKSTPQPPRNNTPSPPSSVSDLYPALAPLFPNSNDTSSTTAPSLSRSGGAPVPIPTPGTPPFPSVKQESPPAYYYTLPVSPPPNTPPPPSQKHQPPATTPHPSQLPAVPQHAPRAYPPHFNYAPLNPATSLPASFLSSPKHEAYDIFSFPSFSFRSFVFVLRSFMFILYIFPLKQTTKIEAPRFSLYNKWVA